MAVSVASGDSGSVTGTLDYKAYELVNGSPTATPVDTGSQPNFVADTDGNSANFTFETTGRAFKTYRLIATFTPSGGANYQASDSGADNHVSVKGATTLTRTTQGNTYTYSVSRVGTYANPPGLNGTVTVNFTNNQGAAQTPVTLNVGANGSVTPTFSASSRSNIQATYNGNDDYATSQRNG